MLTSSPRYLNRAPPSQLLLYGFGISDFFLGIFFLFPLTETSLISGLLKMLDGPGLPPLFFPSFAISLNLSLVDGKFSREFPFL